MANTQQHPPVEGCLVSFPTPEILLLTLNRPEKRNSISRAVSADIIELWNWFDAQPHLQVGIITGTGESFCAGADLKGMSPLDPSTDDRRPTQSAPPHPRRLL
jgi:enoyl-CoA hydratase/carnithine racemase